VPSSFLIVSCQNNIIDGSETDVDCGGNCKVCQNDFTCLINDDCQSDLCNDNICTEELVLENTKSYALIQLNKDIIYSTDSPREVEIDIGAEVRQQLNSCQSDMCEIVLEFESKNMVFNVELDAFYEHTEVLPVRINNKEFIGNSYDVQNELSKLCNEDQCEYSIIIKSNNPIMIDSFTVNYMTQTKTANLASQINQLCETYPCKVPISLSSNKGGEIIINNLQLDD